MGGDNVTHTLVSLSRGAGAACADRLPDTFSFFPVNGCSSDRESGSLRLPGGARAVGLGLGAGARRDVDLWVLRGAGCSQAARGGLCPPPPGYFSTFPG